MPSYFPPASGGGSAVWGGITGTLGDQTDLDNALDGKQDLDVILTLLSALSLAGQGDKFLGVNTGADDFEFKDAPSGGGIDYAASSSGTEDVVQLPNADGDLYDSDLVKTGLYQMSLIRALGSKELAIAVESAATALDFKNVYGELRQAATAVMRFYASNVRFKEPVGIQDGTFFSPNRTLEVRDASNPPIRISNTVQTVDLGVNASSQLEANGAQVPALTLSGNGSKLVAANSGGTAYEFITAPTTGIPGSYLNLSSNAVTNLTTSLVAQSFTAGTSSGSDITLTSGTDIDISADGVYLVTYSGDLGVGVSSNAHARLYNGATFLAWMGEVDGSGIDVTTGGSWVGPLSNGDTLQLQAIYSGTSGTWGKAAMSIVRLS